MRLSSFGREWRSDLGSSLIDDTTRDIVHASNNITPQARGDIPNPGQFFPLKFEAGFLTNICSLRKFIVPFAKTNKQKGKKITTTDPLLTSIRAGVDR